MLGILYVVTLVANTLPLTCFPMGRILLAGVPVLMIVRLYGTGWGIPAALLAPLFALATGHAVTPEFLWVAEAAVIGLFLRRGVNHLMTASALFWGLLAWPVLYLIYGFLLHYPATDLIRIVGFTTFNGLGNAAVATLLLYFLHRKSLLSGPTVSFLETEINAIAGAFLLPGLIIFALNLPAPRDFIYPGLEGELVKRGKTIRERMGVFHAELSCTLAALTNGAHGQDSLEVRLDRLLRKERYLKQVFVWDIRGKLLITAAGSASGEATAGSVLPIPSGHVETFLRQTAPVFTTLPVEGSKGSLPGLVCPLQSEGKRIGVALVIIAPDSYRDILGTAKTGEPAALLVDHANRVLGSGTPAWHPNDFLAATLFDPVPAQRQLLLWNPDSERLSRILPPLFPPGAETEGLIPPDLVFSIPPSLWHDHINRLLLGSMSLMLLPCGIALAVAYRVHKKIIAPIKRLARATEDLPAKARGQTLPEWPSPVIAEVLELSRHCQETARALALSYAELDKQRRQSTDNLDNLLAQHRWESFTSSRRLEKTTRQLAKEKHQRHRVQELIDNIDAAESRYRLLIENSLVGIFVYQQHRYTYVNPRFAEIFGYTPDEITDAEEQPELVHPDDRLLVTANHLKMFGGEKDTHVHYEFTGLRKSGETIHVEALIGRGVSEGTPVLIGSLLDITERKEAEKTIEHLAFHDPLTGLPNRLLFIDRINQAIARAHRHHESFALMFIDLDRFKTLNDSLGHTAGDEALKDVAKRLRGCLRETDTVSRFGGDEFNILLSRSSHDEETELVAHKILKALAWPYDIGGHEVFLTCSIGIATYPKDGREANTLVKNADTALYRAKDLGRNNFQFYSSSMNAKALERMAMESSLRRIFERQELRVHYQPQVDLVHGRITGLEGLVRWEHPAGNMIAPSVFVPLAEETGLIVPMGEWVLQAGCYQLKTWLDAGFPAMRLGINVSAHQLQKKDFADLVLGVLKECGLPPAYLNLEITETVIMHNMNEAFETLRRLRSVGITVSIDDFGTGFSSLSYLKDLPADHLKIDRAFVQNLPFSNNEANIARHIIDMAHGLNLKVIAEGVENRDQLNFLQEAGCDEIQGFLVSRPLPAEDITEILTAGEPLLVIGEKRDETDVLEGGADVKN